MRLDRNAWGRGKYAIINLRKAMSDGPNKAVAAALDTLRINGLIEYGEPGTENEFFVLKLKDQFAGPALARYAAVAACSEPHADYAQEVMGLAHRAGKDSPFCKLPD
jgi:hypothetical protein